MKNDNAPVGETIFSLAQDYFTKPQLAQALCKTVRTIDRMILLRDAPPLTRVGRTVLFRRDAVRQWLRSKEESPHVSRSGGRR